MWGSAWAQQLRGHGGEQGDQHLDVVQREGAATLDADEPWWARCGAVRGHSNSGVVVANKATGSLDVVQREGAATLDADEPSWVGCGAARGRSNSGVMVANKGAGTL